MHETIIKNLSFSYPGTNKLVLKDINMDVGEGEFVSILGQSGCGKSTLLRLLAGLEKQSSGEILLDGTPFSGPSLNRGVVFQDYGLFPWMTAGENIMLALTQRFPKRDKKELKRIALDMINAVGLDKSVYNKLPKELSGGMKQRCAIARAFAIDPPILLMDEPFGALDAVTRAKLQDMVIELWHKQEPKKTVFSLRMTWMKQYCSPLKYSFLVNPQATLFSPAIFPPTSAPRARLSLRMSPTLICAIP